MRTPAQSAQVAPRGLVLAAGASSRMGAPKALLPWRGEPLVAHAVRPLLQAGLAQVVVVVGAWPQVAAAVPAPAHAVVAADWAQGMRASLRAGLAALGRGPVILTHVDRPGVLPDTVRALLAVPGDPSVVPTFQGQPGHPVRLAHALRARLAEPDDTPLRALLVDPVPLPVVDPAVVLNLNRPGDYEAWRRHAGE